jgi:regulator of sirC expression with transglutaminase-like and TPR domain
MVDRAIALNPNSADAWRPRGWAYQIADRGKKQLEVLKDASVLG